MAELFISDFDRAMFRTDDYAEDLLRGATELAQLPSLQTEEIIDRLRSEGDTVSIRGLLNDYDMAYSDYIDRVEPAGDDYLYPDGRRFVERVENLWVVTTAENQTLQEKKLKSVGLEGRATIVDGNKGEYIADSLVRTNDGLIFPDFSHDQAFEQITITDDRLDAVEVLLRVAGIRVVIMQRPDTKYPLNDHAPSEVLVLDSYDSL